MQITTFDEQSVTIKLSNPEYINLLTLLDGLTTRDGMDIETEMESSGIHATDLIPLCDDFNMGLKQLAASRKE